MRASKVFWESPYLSPWWKCNHSLTLFIIQLETSARYDIPVVSATMEIELSAKVRSFQPEWLLLKHRKYFWKALTYLWSEYNHSLTYSARNECTIRYPCRFSNNGDRIVSYIDESSARMMGIEASKELLQSPYLSSHRNAIILWP